MSSWSLAALKFWSRALTAPNLLPSTASNWPPKSDSWRHSTVNCRATARSGLRLSFRKSAMVLKSGESLPSSHITSTLRWHSASSCREERIRCR